jgi:hypothetical protein
MTDRPVRLGDVVEDYCPRCRLLLNHDVASFVGSEVAKVTCRTCYNTHDYRKGDVPKRKAKKDDKKTLMDQVLQNLPLPPVPSASAPPTASPSPASAEEAPVAASSLPQRKRRDLWADLERIKKR